MAIIVWGYHLFSRYYMLSTLHLILYSLKKKKNHWRQYYSHFRDEKTKVDQDRVVRSHTVNCWEPEYGGLEPHCWPLVSPSPGLTLSPHACLADQPLNLYWDWKMKTETQYLLSEEDPVLYSQLLDCQGCSASNSLNSLPHPTHNNHSIIHTDAPPHTWNLHNRCDIPLRLPV